MVTAVADGTIGGGQRFDTAADRNSAGCACAAGIAVAVVLVVVNAADVMLIEPVLEEYLIALLVVVVRLAVFALDAAAYQDASAVVSD